MIQGEIMMMTREQLLEKSTVLMVMEARTEFDRAQQINDYLERCKLHKCKCEATKLIASVKKELKEKLIQEQKSTVINNTTHFGYGTMGELNCGMWVADMSGVKAFSDKGGYRLACYHPILPEERLFNLETGTEKIKLAYYRDHKWKTKIVDKDMIASNTKIIKLAAYGISVTSESSKNLVSYLADVENLNDIPVSNSTSKFGWQGSDFIPLDETIKFDDESRFKELANSIKMAGSLEIWLDMVKKYRANKEHCEPQVYMSASFASVLVSKLNVLPFIVNLWGFTGRGKTVALKMAASIWADPGDGKYITDSYATQNAFEARLDVLNHLPLCLDDMSKVRDKMGGDFTDLVYLLCSGKGKDRSNIDLGINKAKTWSNTILSNMERPLATETMKGGAINRIIDFEMAPGYIFPDSEGNKVVEILNDNYGFAGYAFIDIIKKIGIQEIIKIRKDYEQQIKEEAKRQQSEKEEKQIIPLSLILTADKLATDYIFRDGIYLDIPLMVKNLKDVNEVSEGQRAYDAIWDYVAMNQGKFTDTPTEFSPEKWGFVKDGYVNIIPTALKAIATKENFSVKAFCSWAKAKGVLRSNYKNLYKVRSGDKTQNYYSIKDTLSEEITDFVDGSEEVPFT